MDGWMDGWMDTKERDYMHMYVCMCVYMHAPILSSFAVLRTEPIALSASSLDGHQCTMTVIVCHMLSVLA